MWRPWYVGRWWARRGDRVRGPFASGREALRWARVANRRGEAAAWEAVSLVGSER